ncbi:hypothetical protein H0H81_011024 [Sphagnurus paluster]|uniref:Gelsolin repeat protein n=1 Tax=Sphagnurus paluster TaxID=117069 RepID=A0A9P7K418_9AGAR|nr:hypothetical protein H0H81_011024 [Sphagnurus paluster]
MESRHGSSRSRTEVPELKPEAGLAEWTSKIKALQRQVDADEEAEQIRLEQEIAASRLARIRRSQGFGHASRTSSDLSKLKDGLPNFSQDEADATLTDRPKSFLERQSNHADAMQRLTGAPPTSNTNIKNHDLGNPSAHSQPHSESKQAIPLAAFMGGRATGPRLNKHAPQHDAHDPTQFEQRSFAHSPHPMFGTGGVAMPGIAVQRDGIAKPSAVASLSKAKLSGRVSELPSTTKTYSETYERSPVTRGQEIRERTASTPSYVPSSPWGPPKQTKTISMSQTPRLVSSASSSATQDREGRNRSNSPAHSGHKPTDRPMTPHLSADVTGTTVSSKSHITVPSLAGPIRPEPRPPTSGPHIPPSTVPSKAFMRPLQQKEPTPSLSRLQGRGFVQSMVQVSSQLETQHENPNSSPATPEKNKRKSSVLDRWQPNVSSSVPSSPTSPTPRGIRRSITADPAMSEKPKPSRAESPKRLKSALSNPSLRQENIPPRPNQSSKLSGGEKVPAVGLGSATTLVVFKPTPIEVPPVVDEFGFKPPIGSRGEDTGLGSPAPSKPLSHPTKERARKPRKQKTPPNQIHPPSSLRDTKPSLDRPRSVIVKKVSFKIENEIEPQTQKNTIVSLPLDEPKAPEPALDPIQGSSPRLLPVSTVEPRPSFPTPGSEFSNRLPQPLPGLQGDGKQDLSKQTCGQSSIDQTSRGSIRHALPGMAPNISTNDKALPSKQFTTEQTSHGSIRRALPGMTNDISTTDKIPASKQLNVDGDSHSLVRHALPALVPMLANAPNSLQPTPAPQHTPLSPLQEATQRFGSAQLHEKLSRGQSIGRNRPTVMDVAQAQALSEADRSNEKPESEYPQAISAKRPHPDIPSSPTNAEKPKASYEKYSYIILPSLKEEATPTPTPVGTLLRKEVDIREQIIQKDKDAETCSEPLEPETNTSRAPPVENKPLDGSIFPPPGLNIDALLKYTVRPVQLEPGTTTVSVEVLVITGTTASTLTKDLTIFYETEILAIIHRSKAHLTGLVSTSVWGWEGKRATMGGREQRKLQELAQRYGTTANIIHQNSEPPLMVHILGGVLAIRQGTRTHWTPENTAMHLVRSLRGVILIDQKDLSIKNLCSAYSYCVSILDSVYIWYGRGSTALERKAALEYGHSLVTGVPPIELNEGGSDNDEMFWMILGDEEYANADYWRWRKTSSIGDPRIWRAGADLGKDCIWQAIPIDFLSNETGIHNSVYIIDCIWEFYVMVGSNARARRRDIEFALLLASVSNMPALGEYIHIGEILGTLDAGVIGTALFSDSTRSCSPVTDTQGS